MNDPQPIQIRSLKIPKPKPKPTFTQGLPRRKDYFVPWTGKLTSCESWELQPFQRAITKTSMLDRRRALEFSKFGVEVIEEDGYYVVTFGGADNVFVEVHGGDAAVAIASGVVSLIKALIDGQQE